MRLAGAAALGTVAYQSGKRHEEQAQVDEQAQAAPAPAAAAPADDTTAELERLAQLHQQGVLTDEEFSAAKAKALGI
jgi:multidrug resistance efflux pump